MTDAGKPLPASVSRGALAALGLALFAIILLRTAWLSDAAYLTLRSIEHAASGFGLRWNVTDRVQVYDHPLWLLVLLAGRLVTGDTYFTTIAISMAASLASVWIVLRRASHDATVVLVGAAVALSPLFVTFSTSGLESPLVHLLVAAFTVVALSTSDSRRAPVALGVLAGLLLLTRWTTILLIAPLLLPLIFGSIRRARAVLMLSGLPILLWTAGAWWYYGTIGSNVSLADRTTDAAWSDRIAAGWSFFLETTRLDPLLVAVVLIGVLIGLVARGTDAKVALGSLLAMVGTIASGGSAMAGRDLTAPFLVGLILIVRYLSTRGPVAGGLACAGVVLMSALAPNATLASGVAFGEDFAPTARTHDARAEMYQATGLLLESRPHHAPVSAEVERARHAAQDGEAAAVSSTPGVFGIAAGPGVYVMDPRGATDPLLARLPPAVGTRWIWGASRRLPDGYLDRLPDEAGDLKEPSLRRLDGEIQRATRAPLLSADHLGALIGLGRRARPLIADSSYGPHEMALDEFTAGEARTLGEGGLIVRLREPRTVMRLAALLSARYDYRIDILNGSATVATLTSARAGWDPAPDGVRNLALTGTTTATAVWFRCERGTGSCVVGQVSLGD